MPIVLQKRDTRGQGLNDLGHGMTGAVQNWLTGSREMQRQQMQYQQGMMQAAMMGQRMQEHQLERAQKQKVLEAFGGIDFNNPAQAQKQLLPIMALDPQRAGAAMSGLFSIQQSQRQQEERDMEKGALEYLYKKQGMPVPWAKEQPQPAGEVPQLVTDYANKMGVDPDVAHRIASTESGYNQGAVSPAGAQGVFQLMPSAAKDMGVDRGDLEDNIKGGIGYYKKMLDTFGGNEGLAAMAYNWGQGNVGSWLEKGVGLDNQPIPKETKDYVKKVAGVSIEDLLLPGKAGVMAGKFYDAQTEGKKLELEERKFQESQVPKTEDSISIAAQRGIAKLQAGEQITPIERDAIAVYNLSKGTKKDEGWRKQKSEMAGKVYSEYREDAKAAEAALADYKTLSDLYDRGLKTGFGQEYLDQASRVASRLGLDSEKIGLNSPENAQAANMLLTKNIMNQLAMQKGVQTEGDAQRAGRTWASLGNTPEANRFINEYAKNIANRKIEKSRFIMKTLDETGGDINAAEDAWAQHVGALPSLVPESRVSTARAHQSTKQPQQTQPQAFDFSAMSDEELLRGL